MLFLHIVSSQLPCEVGKGERGQGREADSFSQQALWPSRSKNPGFLALAQWHHFSHSSRPVVGFLKKGTTVTTELIAPQHTHTPTHTFLGVALTMKFSFLSTKALLWPGCGNPRQGASCTTNTFLPLSHERP